MRAVITALQTPEQYGDPPSKVYQNEEVKSDLRDHAEEPRLERGNVSSKVGKRVHRSELWALENPHNFIPNSYSHARRTQQLVSEDGRPVTMHLLLSSCICLLTT